ncbi:MAG TPA: hypothetical protein PLG79_05720, partial [Spirochaetales bacterium]|nr:hypothetical protein [Spirochaetales bacterium]
MRLQISKNFIYTGQSGPLLRFQGSSGEVFELAVLDSNVFRFRFLPDGVPRLKRTWAITGLDRNFTTEEDSVPGPIPTLPLDVSREGRSREDFSIFPCPPFEHYYHEGRYKVSTNGISVDIDLETLNLSWYYKGMTCFASDLPTKGYCYD